MLKTWEKESQKKILKPKDLNKKVLSLRKDKETIVTLNGAFDILHVGHLEIIYQASLQASCLILLLNSDESIKAYKKKTRPINELSHRLCLISAISFISYVTWFEQSTPIKLLDIIKPDVHVNGYDYKDNCIEEPIVKKNGGRVHLVKLINNISTSLIIKKEYKDEINNYI